MEYIDLKEKLEKLLSEDLTNRNTLQDTRRNLFLNAEGTKVQQQLVFQKDTEIHNLNRLVEKKKSIVQLKDDEIAELKNKLTGLEEKIGQLESAHETEIQTLTSRLQDTTALNKLSIQNEEYGAKIRELIYHIDSQNAEIEKLQEELTSAKLLVSDESNQAGLLEEKKQLLSVLTEKMDLLSNSEHTLKTLVASQNLELANQQVLLHKLKSEKEEIAAGWQAQHEQLLQDNAFLQADLSMLNLELVSLRHSTTESDANAQVTDQLSHLALEKEHLSSELQAVKHELEKISQQKDEKLVLLQSEIGSLQSQIRALQEGIQLETAEKLNLGDQLNQLTAILRNKEEQLAATETKSEDEHFITKLLSQVNLLNEQRHTFETLYENTEKDLKEATETLSSLTQVVENQKHVISDLEHTNNNIKLAQTLMLQVKDKTAAKQAINELIREIDGCIALLSD